MHHLFCVIAVQLAILKSINKQIKNASERFDNWRAADNGKLVADDPEFINERKIMTFTLPISATFSMTRIYVSCFC